MPRKARTQASAFSLAMPMAVAAMATAKDATA